MDTLLIRKIALSSISVINNCIEVDKSKRWIELLREKWQCLNCNFNNTFKSNCKNKIINIMVSPYRKSIYLRITNKKSNTWKVIKSSNYFYRNFFSIIFVWLLEMSLCAHWQLGEGTVFHLHLSSENYCVFQSKQIPLCIIIRNSYTSYNCASC